MGAVRLLSWGKGPCGGVSLVLTFGSQEHLCLQVLAVVIGMVLVWGLSSMILVAHTRPPGSASVGLVSPPQFLGQQAPTSLFHTVRGTTATTAIAKVPGSWLRVDARDVSTVHTDEGCTLPYSYAAVLRATSCVLDELVDTDVTPALAAAEVEGGCSESFSQLNAVTELPNSPETRRHGKRFGTKEEGTTTRAQAAAEARGGRTMLESFGTALGITAFLFAGLPTWLLYV
jgi:hypothetical protein